MQDRTINFLTNNMKEMEIELRAQSIALDALGSGLVKMRDMPEALRMARSSEAMLNFVEQKYDELLRILPLVDQAESEEEAARLLARHKVGGLRQ